MAARWYSTYLQALDLIPVPQNNCLLIQSGPKQLEISVSSEFLIYFYVSVFVCMYVF